MHRSPGLMFILLALMAAVCMSLTNGFQARMQNGYRNRGVEIAGRGSFHHVTRDLSMRLSSTDSKVRTVASKKSSSSVSDTQQDSKKQTSDTGLNIAALAPVPLLLFGGYEVANAANSILLDPSKASYIGAYWRYFLSGALSVSFAHFVTVPFDVVKTRIQLETDSIGVLDMGKSIIGKEGYKGLLTGAGPTVTGYFVQGALKYGFYEIFKPAVQQFFEQQGIEIGNIADLMVAAGLAELIGSTVLGPFEAARIRMVALPSFSNNVFDCLVKIAQQEGLGSLFLGLPPLWLKNVPYTALQLSTFEIVTSFVYSTMANSGMSSAKEYELRYFVTFGSALVAAVMASLFSQPGDTLLSIVKGKSANNAADAAAATAATTAAAASAAESSSSSKGLFSLKTVFSKADTTTTTTTAAAVTPPAINPFTVMNDAYQKLGFRGLFKGTKARLVHVSVIVGVQLTLYDVIKQFCGIPTTGFH